MTTSSTPERHRIWPTLRPALPGIIGIFLVSRLLLLFVVTVLEATIPISHDGPEYSDAPILGGLTGEDAIYYLGIAAEGYHLEPVKDQYVDWVYFPLFPLATKVVAPILGGDIALAGVVVSNLATLVAFALLYVLAVPHLGPMTALRSIGLVAFAPGAVAFGMAYSDSLMLALVAAAFLAAERGRGPLMGILYGLAVLARPPGLLFGLPLLAALVVRDGRRPTTRWLWLAAGPLAIVGFMAYQGLVLGDPFAYVRGQQLWAIPPAVAAPTAPSDGVGTIAPLVVLLFATLLGYTALLGLVRRDRIRLDHALVAVVALGSVFLSGRLQSDARYLVVGWPFAWVLASRASFAGRDLLPLAWGGLYVLMAFLNVTQALAP